MTHRVPGPPAGVIRRGLAILMVSVREQPKVFAVSAVGSTLFALTTIAQAYVFGIITERVIVPSLERGEAAPATLAVCFIAVMAVATLKVVGIVARRLAAGIMQYRRPAA